MQIGWRDIHLSNVTRNTNEWTTRSIIHALIKVASALIAPMKLIAGKTFSVAAGLDLLIVAPSEDDIRHAISATLQNVRNKYDLRAQI